MRGQHGVVKYSDRESREAIVTARRRQADLFAIAQHGVALTHVVGVDGDDGVDGKVVGAGIHALFERHVGSLESLAEGDADGRSIVADLTLQVGSRREWNHPVHKQGRDGDSFFACRRSRADGR